MRLFSLLLLLCTSGVVEAADKEAREKKLLKGTWRVVSVQGDGRDFSRKLTPKCLFIFTGDTVILQDNSKAPECLIKLDPTKKPRTIDLTFRKAGETLAGIYELDGNDLRVCYAFPGEKRPTRFTTKPDGKAISFRLKRARADDAVRQQQLDSATPRARALHKQGKWGAAIREYEKALVLCEDVHGPDHPQTGALMVALADLYRLTSQYRRAEPLYTRSLRIAGLTFGPDHEVVEVLSHNLALVCQALGEFDRAEALFQHSLKLAENRLGKRAAETGVSLLSLGSFYIARGSYDDARRMLERALSIFRNKYGDEHLRTALAWNALGLLERTLGHYEAAEDLYTRSLRALEKDPRPNLVEVAKVRNNLATLYTEMGQFAKGLRLLRESLKVLEKQLPQQQLEVALTLNNLGRALWGMGRQEDALTHIDRSVKLMEAAAGANSPQLAKLLHNQAHMLLLTGHGEEAGKLHLRSQRLLEAALGSSHPEVAISLFGTGAIWLFAGQPEKAAPFYERSLDILRRTLGSEHPTSAQILVEYGILQALRGKPEAWKILERGLEIQQRHLRQVFRFSSEPAMRDYLARANLELDWVVGLAAGRPGANPDAVKTALTWTLRRKTAVFDTLCRFREAQRRADQHPDVKRLVTRSRQLEQELNSVALRPWEDVEALAKKITTLSRERDRVVARLHRLLSREAPQHFGAREAVELSKVQQCLPRGAALVEFQRALIVDPKAKNILESIKEGHYIAFVLTAGNAPPKLIDLGEAAPIDRGIQDLHELLYEVRRGYENKAHLPLDEKAEEKKWREGDQAEGGGKRAGARKMYDRVFARLRPALAGATLVCLAPARELNRLPFEALVGPDGKYLVETYRFAYLSSGRDLLRPRPRQARGTLVFAGPNYKLTVAGRQARLEELRQGQLKKRLALVAADEPTDRQQVHRLRSDDWDPLEGAGAEAKMVEQALGGGPYAPVKVFQGNDALEEVFKAQPAPRLLHLATHGYFHPAPPGEKRRYAPIRGPLGMEQRIKALDNPLLRSGFYLAGAGVLVPRGLKEPVQDGWVTAAEVALLNLDGTELVVLSACKTGLGDLGRVGEGVSGLRWAFQYAGARTLIASLFDVPDAETQELMKELYTGLKARRTKLDALHAAQLHVIRASRRRTGAAHPFFWAGFVLVGAPD